MSVYKKLLVLGVCAAVLTAPMQAAAANVGGAGLERMLSQSGSTTTEETKEECRTRIENEITDSYNSKVKQIDESSLSAADKTAAIKKLDDAKALALKSLKTRDSKKWM